MIRLLTHFEITRALSANKEMFPARLTCAKCGEYWQAHAGEICPFCIVCNLRACEGIHPFVKNKCDIVLPHSLTGIDVKWIFCKRGMTAFEPDIAKVVRDANIDFDV